MLSGDFYAMFLLKKICHGINEDLFFLQFRTSVLIFSVSEKFKRGGGVIIIKRGIKITAESLVLVTDRKYSTID